MVIGDDSTDNYFFKGINRFRLHDYQLLLAKAYDAKFTGKQQHEFLRKKLTRIRGLSKSLSSKNDILTTLHEIENTIRDADNLYKDQDQKLLEDLLLEIRKLHQKIDEDIKNKSFEEGLKQKGQEPSEALSQKKTSKKSKKKKSTSSKKDVKVQSAQETKKKKKVSRSDDKKRLNSILKRINTIKSLE